MFAVFGALLLAAGVVLYRWAYIHHRRPVRSAWARNGLASMLVQFAIISLLAAGLSFAVQFVLGPEAGALTPIEAASVLVIAVVTAILLRLLNRQWRRFLADPAAVQADAHRAAQPANDPGPGLPPAGGLGNARRRA